MRIIKPLLFSLICIGVVQIVPTKAQIVTVKMVRISLAYACCEWGDWGPKEVCPYGHSAYAFRLKVGSEEVKDKTALNAIELSCKPVRSLLSGRSGALAVSRITSKEGEWGEWKELQTCSNGFLTGMRMKSQAMQGRGLSPSRDDTAANDLEMECMSSGETHNGGGNSKGEWSLWSRCPPGMTICGLRTLVEDNIGSDEDNTALNNVQMYCCH